MNKSCDVIELTLELCATPSISGQEAEVVNVLESTLRALGYVTRRQTVGASGRDNLLAFIDGAAPQILLSTHIDTVPPFFAPKRESEWLVGRGVCDAKGIAAAMICAATELHRAGEHRVALLFVVGEETDSSGAKAAVYDFAPKVKYIINGEPTDLKLATAMKGALVVDLEAFGKAGHSAYPSTGHSALHQLIEDSNAILHHSWPSDADFGDTTVNVGRLEGGVAGNVIAEHASAVVVVRASADVDDLERQFKGLLHEGTAMKVRSKSQPAKLYEVSGIETCVVAFGSDVPHLRPLGTTLLIGPGSILDAHTDHERVRVSDLKKAVQVYKDLCQKLLS